MVNRFLTSLALLAVSAPAFAAVDILPTIAAPSGVSVYGSGRWYVTVSNSGSNTASNVSLTIALPRTNTSPSVYVMGTVTAKSSNCSTSGTNLVCTIGTVKGRKSATPVYFDITFPESINPLTVTASVTTTSSESTANQVNNTTSTDATLANYNVTFGTSIDTLNRHCTGTALASFYECELFPSSISDHQAILNADGSITFPTEDPLYGGTWVSDSDDHLVFEYTYDGAPVANFEGWGVSTDCWEGQTTFPDSTYVSMYEVCVQ